jgi:hypothetical protein
MAAGALALGLALFLLVLVGGVVLGLPGNSVMVGAAAIGALTAALVLLFAKAK